MGLHNRPYMDEAPPQRPLRGLMLGLPPAGRVVKFLIIANVAMYVLQLFVDHSPGMPGPMSRWLGVTVDGFWQVYRYITFQFLHDPDSFWHILLNMLGIYVLGSPLEGLWGGRKFLVFYLACGMTAGIAYVIIGAATSLPGNYPIIGASGGVFGLLLAAAVYVPHIQIIFLFFPVPIRLASIIIFAGMLVNVASSISQAVRGDEWKMYHAMSDVAHLGGAVMAAGWIWLGPGLLNLRRAVPAQLGRGAWKRKMDKRIARQQEIDRILQKIHDQGINSLSRREREILQEATKRQQGHDKDLYRV